MQSLDALRQHLTALIRGGQAFVPLAEALDGLSVVAAGTVPPGLPHSAWQLAEHLRIAQDDIYQFSVDPGYVSPPWPEGYWPTNPRPPDARAWARTCKALLTGQEAMIDLVTDPMRDLFAPLPHGGGQTLLREALLVAEHNAYHTGQLVQVRRALGLW